MPKQDTLDFLEPIDTVVAARGKKTREFTLEDLEDSEELFSIILGRTGNLRAPALRVGNKLVVGYHQDLYQEIWN